MRGPEGLSAQRKLPSTGLNRRCPSCFTFNAAALAKCQACETPNPRPRPQATAGATQPIAPGPFAAAFGADPFKLAAGAPAAPAAAASGAPFGGDPFSAGGAPAAPAATTSGAPFGGDPFAAAKAPVPTPGGDPFHAAGSSSATAAAAALSFAGDPFKGAAPAASAAEASSAAFSATASEDDPFKFFRGTGAVPIGGADQPAGAAGIRTATVLAPEPPQTRSSGDVYVWGSGECSQLGLPEMPEDGVLFVPARIPSLRRIVSIAAGGMHTLALADTGEVWSWGCNDDMVLGRGGSEELPGRVEFTPASSATSSSSSSAAADTASLPNIIAVTAGDSHSAALTEDGSVYAWGTYKGKDGRLGFTPSTMCASRPVLMVRPSEFGRVAKVTSGHDHTAAVTQGGRLLTWGCGESGQLGHAVTTVRMRGDRHKAAMLRVRAIKVMAREARDSSGRMRKGNALLADAFAAGFSTWVLTRAGTVLACGLDSYGQLGRGQGGASSTFVPIPALTGRRIRHIAAGAHHAIVRTEDGSVLAMLGSLLLLGPSLEMREPLSTPVLLVQLMNSQ